MRNLRLLVTFAVLLIMSSTQAQTAVPNGIRATVPPTLAVPSFELLRETLTKKSIQSSKASKRFTVGHALKTLKERPEFRSLFKNYTLVKSSPSLQPATDILPRALLFGNTAKLILTFNSDPSFEGGFALESAEFDESTHQILFREILFKDEMPIHIQNNFAQETLLQASDIEYQDEKLIITRPNPEKCMLCHAISDTDLQHARYIWNSYLAWPGVYGEMDDKLNSSETETLRQFKIRGARHERYVYLEHIQEPNSSAPYDQVAVNNGPLHLRPNLLLTEYLSYRQAEAIAANLVPLLSPEDQRAFRKSMKCMPSDSSILVKTLSRYLPPKTLERVMSFDRSSITGITRFGDLVRPLTFLGIDLSYFSTDKTMYFNSGADSLLSANDRTYVGKKSFFALVKQELYKQLIANDPQDQAELNAIIQSNESDGTVYGSDDTGGLSSEALEYLRSHVNFGGSKIKTLRCP